MITTLLAAIMPPSLPPRKPFGDIALDCEMRSVAGDVAQLRLQLKEADLGGRHGYRWSVATNSPDYPPMPEGDAEFSGDNTDSPISWITVTRGTYAYQYQLSLDGMTAGDLVEKFGLGGHLVVYRRATNQYYGLDPVGLGFCRVAEKVAK